MVHRGEHVITYHNLCGTAITRDFDLLDGKLVIINELLAYFNVSFGIDDNFLFALV